MRCIGTPFTLHPSPFTGRRTPDAGRRTPDAAGRDLFTDALNRGVSRADVVVGFSEAGEHVRNVIAQDTALSSSSAFLLADPSARLGIIPVLPGQLLG